MNHIYLRGQIYYADLDPVVGSEQMGTRPVLILQNNVGNHFARTVIIAPITSRVHAKSKLPIHSYIGMIGRMKYPSVVMLEQLRTLDKRRIGYYVACPPYGYRKAERTTDQLVPDENTAPVVKKIFDLAASGQSCRSIAIRLNEACIMPPLKYRVECRDNFTERGAQVQANRDREETVGAAGAF